nr:piRNA biogenesis protein EXD1 [Anolis sagrei ordinatus]
MDRSIDLDFLHDILGRTLKLTLKHSTFQGVLQHLDSSQSVFLNKVTNLESGRYVPGVKMFFGHEIINVELLDDLEQHAGEKKTTATKCGEVAATKIPTSDKGEPLKPSIQDVEAHFQEMQELRLSTSKYNFAGDKREKIEYVVVDQFQKKFGYAMVHIKKQAVCSIAAEGVNLCRYGKLSWFQVATKSRVFLFDVFLLGPRVFKNGLQIILEDQHILKVIHDCRWLSDCLSHQYGIELTNVFDTQVADVLQFSVETGGFLPRRIRNLQECLIEYLGMSRKDVSFMDVRQHEIERNAEVWFMRPLSPALLNVLALETVYLLPLRLMLLDEIMSDLTTLVDGYLNAFRKGSADLLGSRKISCMELPRELRQLEDFHKNRRENALRKFQVNEDGLLIRKQIAPLRGKRAQKDGNEKNGTKLTPSNKIASPKAYNANCLHPVGHENAKIIEQRVSHCDNQGETVSGDIEDAWRQEAQLVHLQPSNHEPQTKVAGTLEEEIRQLLTQ